jgi:hypothetical protein
MSDKKNMCDQKKWTFFSLFFKSVFLTYSKSLDFSPISAHSNLTAKRFLMFPFCVAFLVA